MDKPDTPQKKEKTMNNHQMIVWGGGRGGWRETQNTEAISGGKCALVEGQVL